MDPTRRGGRQGRVELGRIRYVSDPVGVVIVDALHQIGV